VQVYQTFGLTISRGKKMRKLVFMSLLITLIIFPAASFAIKFDIWETGMSIDEVVSLAFKHDIPIARDGVIHGSKKFNRKLIDDNFYKASTLYYGTGQTFLVEIRGST
jgi:hypothetical protein